MVDMTCCFYTGTKGDIHPQAGRGKGVAPLLKEGEWNTLRVRARGDRFEVWLNGTKTTDYTDAAYPVTAPLGLQVHPGLAMSVQFNNIVVKSGERAFKHTGSLRFYVSRDFQQLTSEVDLLVAKYLLTNNLLIIQITNNYSNLVCKRFISNIDSKNFNLILLLSCNESVLDAKCQRLYKIRKCNRNSWNNFFTLKYKSVE